MAEEKFSELVFLLDRSLSMCGREEQIRKIVNSLIRRYRSLKEKCFISICLFSDELDVLYMHQEDQFARELTARDYYVSGNTAFYDAFRDTVFCLEHSMDYLREHLVREVRFYILTDGADNASCRCSPEECDSLLALKQAQNWKFWQLSLNHDLTKRDYQWRNDVSFVWKKP